MVEEANDYYKTALRRLYDVFQDTPLFSDLRAQHSASNSHPTAQEIATAAGVPSTGAPHESGLESINAYLDSQNKPMLVRNGEWDKVQPNLPSSTKHQHSPPTTYSTLPSAQSSPRLEATHQSTSEMEVDALSDYSEDEEDEEDDHELSPASPSTTGTYALSNPDTPPVPQIQTPPTLSIPSNLNFRRQVKLEPLASNYMIQQQQQQQAQFMYPTVQQQQMRSEAGTVCMSDLDLHVHPLMGIDMGGLPFETYLDNQPANGAAWSSWNM